MSMNFADPQIRAKMISREPLGRVGDPNEIVEAVL